MAETKSKKGKIIIAIVLALVLIATAVVCLLVFLPKNQTPNAVMECNVNPDVQFVLDTNNKVMQVNYLNNDAEVLLKDVNFNGKSAEETAQLFVQLSTEAGYIDVDTTGTRVDITISCDNAENFKELKTKIVNKVNEYFDENGIVAGAVAEIKTGFGEALQKLGVDLSEFSDKTEEEILQLLNEKSNELKDVAYSLQNDLLLFIEELKSSEAFKNLPTLEDSMSKLENQIENSNLQDSVKTQLKAQLKELESQFKTLQENMQKEIDKKIAELKEQSKEIYANAKQTLNALKTEAKQKIEEHKNYVDSNKEAVKSAIEAYRATLNA